MFALSLLRLRHACRHEIFQSRAPQALLFAARHCARRLSAAKRQRRPDWKAALIAPLPSLIRRSPVPRPLWACPPVFTLKGRKSDPGVTNIQHPQRVVAHWPRWLGVESRCVVPFSSFSENEVLVGGTRPPVWFAFDESRPLAFFAGSSRDCAKRYHPSEGGRVSRSRVSAFLIAR